MSGDATGTDLPCGLVECKDEIDKVEAPERPPPPIVGKVTHHNIELYWEDALAKVQNGRKGDGRVRITVQEQDKHGGWGNVYTGYAKKHVLDGLEPWSQYRYRIRFMNDHGNSEWSPSIAVSTTKEPLNGEHLHRAIIRQDLSELERVLDTGEVNVDVPDKYGFSPLMQASQRGHIEMIDTLVKNGADVNLQNDAGKTSLMLAAFAKQYQSVKELRHHGARYDQRDRGGSTALHWAMDGGNVELIEWMMDDGADLTAKDYNGWTPLLRCAAVGGNKDAAAVLLRHKADINQKDKDGKTTLMMAVVNGHNGLVQQLLENGADINSRNEYGKTAYEMAQSMERRQVTKTLEEHLEKLGIHYY